MSRFDLEAARVISSAAVRRNRPLLEGRERNLLRALKRAEKQHDQTCENLLRELELHKRDEALISKLKVFSVQFERMHRHWTRMDEVTKSRLVLLTQGHLFFNNDSVAEPIPAKTLREQLENTFRALSLAADDKVGFRRGAKSGSSRTSPVSNLSLKPLYSFAIELAGFWTSQTGDKKFSGFFEGRTPKSAAARFLCEATNFLDTRYTAANIKTVMEAIRSKRNLAIISEYENVSHRCPEA